MFLIFSCEIPIPSSLMITIREEVSVLNSIDSSTFLPLGVNLRAFESRFEIICLILNISLFKCVGRFVAIEFLRFISRSKAF